MTLKEEGESYDGLPGLSRKIPSFFFEGGRVKTVGQLGVQEGREKGGIDAVYRLPHRIGDVIRSRGEGVRGFGEGPGYFFRGEGGIVLVTREAEKGGR